MVTITTLDADASVADIMKYVDRDGAVILRDVLSAGQLNKLKGEIMPYLDATKHGTDDFQGTKTTRTGALLARSEVCRDMAVNKKVLGVCDKVLKENCPIYQVHVTQAIRIQPGETAQQLHADKWAWSAMFKDTEPQISGMWAITDFTAENGATVVIPGSQHWDQIREPELHEITQAEMKAGSVMIFTGSVLHGGGANNSDSDRIGILIDFALGWLRQEENQYLCCPPEIAKDFDPELRRLLGYSMGTYTIGYYSPPLPPGEGPEAVSPEWAVDPSIPEHVAGDPEIKAAHEAALMKALGFV